jgi:4-diphosphocytidyl-2-C-methyl-D-erythritol kinase
LSHVSSVTAIAPAKLNLTLSVGGPRRDGYHEVATVYHAVGMFDEVVASPAEGLTVTVGADSRVAVDGVPLDATNLAGRAAQVLADEAGRDPDVHLHLRKGIPVAGGMAGGSADAAAALVACDALWGTHLSRADLLALAARLGSDVPFALLGGTAIGTGRGELVEPVADPSTWWWVVVPSREGLSTPAVYRRFDELNPDAPEEPESANALLLALATGDPGTLAGALHNDLEEAAVDLRPDLAELLAVGERSGALRGLVSGSGPTCVFLTSSPDDARGVAGELAGAGQEVVLVANGPVAGAHVVTYA